ncbi:YlbF family regulator [Enterococcus sp. LJL98]
MGFLEEEQALAKEVNQLLALLQNHESIQRFQSIQSRAQNHPGLKALEEQIKAAQKDAVNFAHYEKPEAEKQAIAEIERLNQAYKNHPLVRSYRDSLVEADELLQYLSKRIQKEVNSAIEAEEEEENAAKN